GKQLEAAKRNVQKAQRAATKKRTIAYLPKKTRKALQTVTALQGIQVSRDCRAHISFAGLSSPSAVTKTVILTLPPRKHAPHSTQASARAHARKRAVSG